MIKIKHTFKLICNVYKEAKIFNRMYYQALSQDYGLTKEEVRHRKES